MPKSKNLNKKIYRRSSLYKSYGSKEIKLTAGEKENFLT